MASDQPGIPLTPALLEAGADSITELFNRDPEELTPGDFAQLVEALRAARRAWVAAGNETAKPRSKTVSAKAKALLPAPTASAEEMGI